MSFELRPTQSLGKNVRRILRNQMDKALKQLTTSKHGSRDEPVHEARKCFKKIRAVLRLIRPAIGEKQYRKENICFRDAGRPLTEVRDAKIFIETLNHLEEYFKAQIAGQPFNEIRQALTQNLGAVRKRVLDQQHAASKIARILRQARGQLKSWVTVPDRWASIGPGLQQVYCSAAEGHAAASAEPSIEKLHEWRKQTKYLRYQLEVLEPIWPERIKEVAKEADRMGELLGDDHDLAALRQFLTDNQTHFGEERKQGMLLALIDRRRAELEQEAILLGTRFFQESAADFTSRLKGYWKTWREQQSSAQSDGVALARV